MKTLYLHVGAHKTASSFLQSIIKEKRGKLESDEGITCLFRAEMQELEFFKKIKKINKTGIDLEPTSKDFGSVERLKKSDKVLITNEDFLSSLNPENFFKNTSAKLKYVRALFPEYEIKLILYIRNQVEYLQSCYTQYIHIGRSVSFYDFIGNPGKEVDWYDVCKEISESASVSKLEVIPYEVIIKNGEQEFLNIFLRLLDVKKEYTIDSKKFDGRISNRSYSALAINIANKINPLLEEGDKKKLRVFLQKNFSTATHEKMKFFTKEEEDKVYGKHIESNKKVFSEFVSMGFCGKSLGYY